MLPEGSWRKLLGTLDCHTVRVFQAEHPETRKRTPSSSDIPPVPWNDKASYCHEGEIHDNMGKFPGSSCLMTEQTMKVDLDLQGNK